MGLAAGAGVLGALGQAPYDQPVAMLAALTAAFVLFHASPRKTDAAQVGWAFGVGYFALALSWIVEPFQIDPDRHGWMAPFALVFISTGLALFWGMAFWLARFLSRRGWLLVVTWSAAEMLRAYIFTGFPWASPAQATVDAIGGQSLAWVGPHGVTLWMMSAAFVLSLSPVRFRRKPLRLAQAGTLAVSVALLLVPVQRPEAALTPHWIRIVQPNAAQQSKWDPDKALSFYERQLAMTSALPAPGAQPPDLTLWPETAISWLIEPGAPVLDQIATVAGAQSVALGVLRLENGKLYNSMALLAGESVSPQIYDKHHLVPFGEYIPFADLARRVGLQALADTIGTGFEAGPGPRLLDFGPLGRGLPLICYEAVFAHDVNRAPERPDFLLQATNDAWFGRNAGPQQHLAQARMRAIEQGLPLIRSANTGISAMIDPFGRITTSLPLDTQGFLDNPLPAPLPPTLYGRTGDAPVGCSLAALLGLGLYRRRGRAARSRHL
jgi:apolipoprotein N-acyltransferase